MCCQCAVSICVCDVFIGKGLTRRVQFVSDEVREQRKIEDRNASKITHRRREPSPTEYHKRNAGMRFKNVQ